MEPFDYNLNVRRSWYSDAQIIDSLKRFGETVGNRPFRMQEYREWKGRLCTTGVITAQIGSWRKALKLAGIEGGRVRKANPEDLIENLDRIWRQIGRPPGATRLIELGEYSPHCYMRVWGSIRRACELLADYHHGKITREELLKERGKMRRSPLPASTRWAVLRRDHFICAACGTSRKKDKRVRLHVDHIHPVSRGGTDDLSNLRTLCGRCNWGKGAGPA